MDPLGRAQEGGVQYNGYVVYDGGRRLRLRVLLVRLGRATLDWQAYGAGYVAAVAYHSQLSGRVNLWKGFLSR